MKYTRYNNLNLPDLTDQYNLKHWNENTEKIDDKLNEHQMKLDTSTPETTPSTIMIRNEQGKVKVTTPLEQDDTNMAVNIDYLMNAFRTKMLDEAHPKGEIYYTEDKNFDPNVSWVGTWVRIKDKFIYALGDDGNAGDVGGSKTISVANLPSHSHSFSGSGSHDHSMSHTHTSGEMEIVGTYTANHLTYSHGSSNIQTTGAFYDAGEGSCYGTPGRDYRSAIIGFKANKYHGWSGKSSAPSSTRTGPTTVTISGTTGTSGSGTDYMPPYEKAYCWKRTE